MILTAPVNNIPVKPVYLIYGYDAWQSMDALQKINAKFKSTKKYHFANLAQFIQFNQTNKSELSNRDLFCGSNLNKTIEISIGNAKFTKQQVQELNNLLNNLLNNNLAIILIAEKLDKSVLNSAWFAQVNKIGVVVVTKALSKAGMHGWAENRFKQLNLAITGEALIEFINMYPNNLITAAQSIEKLAIVFENYKASKQPINTAELHQCINQDPKTSIFDLQNALSSKKIDQIILILHNLKEQSQEEILILWAIIQEIKHRLATISSMQMKAKVYNLFAKAAEIDLAIKNIDMVDFNNDQYVWSLIIDICLELCVITNI